MPIYAYKCSACGHAKDVLQKISDPALSVCPACGADAFAKQLTAAGFQLKGSGWYVTDFRDGGAKKKDAPAGNAGSGEGGEAKKSAGGSTADGAAAPAPSPAPAAAPAPAAPTAPSSD